MKTITIPISLPEDIAEQAKKKGLLDADSVVMMFCRALERDEPKPVEMDPRLRKLVNPALYLRGKILGDIVGPIDVNWEAEA